MKKIIILMMGLVLFFPMTSMAMEANAKEFIVGPNKGNDRQTLSDLAQFFKDSTKHVLIVVDDEPTHRKGLSITIRYKLKRPVVVIPSGEDLLDVLSSAIGPDIVPKLRLVIIDFEMPPGKNGGRIAKEIQDNRLLNFNNNTQAVPIVLNTTKKPGELDPEVAQLFSTIMDEKSTLPALTAAMNDWPSPTF